MGAGVIPVGELEVVLSADASQLRTELDSAAGTTTEFRTRLSGLGEQTEAAALSAGNLGGVTRGLGSEFEATTRSTIGQERGLQRVEFALARMVQTGNISMGSLRGLAFGLSRLAPAALPIIGIVISIVLLFQRWKKVNEELQASADKMAEATRKGLEHITEAAGHHHATTEHLIAAAQRNIQATEAGIRAREQEIAAIQATIAAEQTAVNIAGLRKLTILEEIAAVLGLTRIQLAANEILEQHRLRILSAQGALEALQHQIEQGQQAIRAWREAIRNWSLDIYDVERVLNRLREEVADAGALAGDLSVEQAARHGVTGAIRDQIAALSNLIQIRRAGAAVDREIGEANSRASAALLEAAQRNRRERAEGIRLALEEREAARKLAAEWQYVARAMVANEAANKQLSKSIRELGVEVASFGSLYAETITAAAQALGESLVTHAKALQAVFRSVLAVIGGFLQNVGRALIAYGIGVKAFFAALTNPFVAIAAGAVLVALGAAFSSIASQGPGAGTAGGGAGYATSAAPAPQAEQGTVTFILPRGAVFDYSNPVQVDQFARMMGVAMGRRVIIERQGG